MATTTACEPSLSASSRHELGTFERRAVDRDLVRARLEEIYGVGDRAHTATDGERDREPVGDPRDEVESAARPSSVALTSR